MLHKVNAPSGNSSNSVPIFLHLLLLLECYAFSATLELKVLDGRK